MSRKIFDLTALKMKQDRARILGKVNFVDEFAIRHTEDILSDIKRKFTEAAIIGNNAKFWANGIGLKTAKLIDEAENFNFKNGQFDLIIHALSLHRCNDPVGQLIQLRHALRPDGLMLAFLCGGETLRELRMSFEAAEIAIENGISPRVAPMIEIRDAGDLLVRAGFALTVADRTDLEVTYKSPTDLFYDLRAMGETNILYNRQKQFLRRKTFNKLLEFYFNRHSVPQGNGVRATFQLLCLTGWAPSSVQQKPLKPGSATHHFSEVLRTYKL